MSIAYHSNSQGKINALLQLSSESLMITFEHVMVPVFQRDGCTPLKSAAHPTIPMGLNVLWHHHLQQMSCSCQASLIPHQFLVVLVLNKLETRLGFSLGRFSRNGAIRMQLPSQPSHTHFTGAHLSTSFFDGGEKKKQVKNPCAESMLPKIRLGPSATNPENPRSPSYKWRKHGDCITTDLISFDSNFAIDSLFSRYL